MLFRSRASCSGIGMVMTKVATLTALQLFEIRGKLKEDTRFNFEITIVYLRRLRHTQACIVFSPQRPDLLFISFCISERQGARDQSFLITNTDASSSAAFNYMKSPFV